MTSNSAKRRQRIKEQSKEVANYLNKQPLWVYALMVFDSTPGSDIVAMGAVLERIADEIEERGEKGLDLDPGETADWLRAEASQALLAIKPPHPQTND